MKRDNHTFDEIKLTKEARRLKNQNSALRKENFFLKATLIEKQDLINQSEDKNNLEHLNINQLSEFAGLSRLEILCLVSAGKITQYGIGTSAYFLKTEIMQALKITDNKKIAL